VTARVFQFPQYAAERSAQLTGAQGPYPPPQRRAGGRPWGWLFLLSLVGGIWSVVSGYAYWTSAAQRDTGSWLLVGGIVLLAFSALCLCLWVWRFLHGNPPWGRLLLVGMVLNYLVGRPLAGAQPWFAPIDFVLGWGLLIGLVLRWRQLRRGRSAPDKPVRRDAAAFEGSTIARADDAARWAAGAVGENIVADTLARLGNDHVVIHNLPLDGRGDADHVVVGPAGVVVVETKYLAGRIVCQGGGVWTQLKRDELRQIADPAAQVQRAADSVAHILGCRGLPDVPVYAVLVMAHPRAELDVARSSVLVVRPFELVPQLQQLARSRPRLDAAGVTATANALLGSNAPAPGTEVRR
jgi:Nuclease-related domain